MVKVSEIFFSQIKKCYCQVYFDIFSNVSNHFLGLSKKPQKPKFYSSENINWESTRELFFNFDREQFVTFACRKRPFHFNTNLVSSRLALHLDNLPSQCRSSSSPSPGTRAPFRQHAARMLSSFGNKKHRHDDRISQRDCVCVGDRGGQVFGERLVV